jgi:hypothetical protein
VTIADIVGTVERENGKKTFAKARDWLATATP